MVRWVRRFTCCPECRLVSIHSFPLSHYLLPDGDRIQDSLNLLLYFWLLFLFLSQGGQHGPTSLSGSLMLSNFSTSSHSSATRLMMRRPPTYLHLTESFLLLPAITRERLWHVPWPGWLHVFLGVLFGLPHLSWWEQRMWLSAGLTPPLTLSGRARTTNWRGLWSCWLLADLLAAAVLSTLGNPEEHFFLQHKHDRQRFHASSESQHLNMSINLNQGWLLLFKTRIFLKILLEQALLEYSYESDCLLRL